MYPNVFRATDCLRSILILISVALSNPLIRRDLPGLFFLIKRVTKWGFVTQAACSHLTVVCPNMIHLLRFMRRVGSLTQAAHELPAEDPMRIYVLRAMR